jgi:2-oxoglutarate dehydrogenase E1 component
MGRASKDGKPSFDIDKKDLEFEVKVLELIQGYREMGYLNADINPLERGIKSHPLLKLAAFGLTEEDLDRVCEVGQVLGLGIAPLRTILQALTTYYCSPVAVEFEHIDHPRTRNWIQKRVESHVLAKPLPIEQKIRALKKLSEAEALETFLHKRFVGQKRFSVEGTDVIIPMLDFLIDHASLLGADEILVGMAHRGRLNVLANIFHKDLKLMLAEFSGNVDANVGDGDVKYHMGYSQNVQTSRGNTVHLSLMPNPSHLEAVNSVLMGVTRAKQKLKGDTERTRTLAVLLHGDASFSGQGVIYETLNMSELKGYTIGGTIHIILNNQVGFTTTPKEGRSTPHATDIAKMLEVPIFRVNADEVEAALHCVSMALQFRYRFKRDVVIDVVGYRRYGHNEGDEPSFTQPLMYNKIAQHPRVRQIYAQRLVKHNVLEEAQANRMIEEINEKLDLALTEAKQSKVTPGMHSFGDRWKGLHKISDSNVFQKVATGVKIDELVQIGRQLLIVPEGFHLHPKIQKFLNDRQDMLDEKREVDWSLGEAMAFGTLLHDGHAVRLAGQDSERGTFSHRHAVFHDIENGKNYTPLKHLKDAKEDFEIVNSPLSEYAALGFEFGQALANPNKLTLWEAQFGDFVNGAQIIIDQFLTSSVAKWQRYSGLTLLLPHGYEGQGPEHSSARLERFLQACAQNNIQVCCPTTPAQYFHLLRRQMMRNIRLPLVIMSPKSLLRHPLVVSPLKTFQEEKFHEVLEDPNKELKEKAKRLILSYGKIYFELLEARKNIKNQDVALIRMEQFYPFPNDQLSKILSSYKKATDIIWCQEGPQNMGGWNFMLHFLAPFLSSKQTLTYVGRGPQANPADGYLSLHLKEQRKIVLTALGEL